jgi:hypothetical protein
VAGGFDLEAATVHLALEVFLEEGDCVFNEENAECSDLMVGDVLLNRELVPNFARTGGV